MVRTGVESADAMKNVRKGMISAEMSFPLGAWRPAIPILLGGRARVGIQPGRASTVKAVNRKNRGLASRQHVGYL